MRPTTAPSCKICLNRNACFFSALDDPSKKEWIFLRRARLYPRGSAVFHEGDESHGVYVVCEGKVKIFKTTKTGRVLTTKLLPQGSLFGHRSFLAGDVYSAGAEAFVDSIVSRIDEKSFLGFLKRHWPAAALLLKQLALGVREGEDKAREIAFSAARPRLAQVLLSVAKRMDHGRVVGIPRKELAQLAGIVPETCVRILKKFEEESLINRKDRRTITLLKPATLERVSGGAPVLPPPISSQ